ncbi:hypothetical protein [Streptomyces sp. NPDC002540]
MTTTPADELRAAAATLRATALTAAEHSGSSTWYSKFHFPDQPESDFTTLTAGPGRPLHRGGGGRGTAPYMHAPVSEYIALVGPEVGLALADWLDAAASEVGRVEQQYRDRTAGEHMAPHALAVARKILGTTGPAPSTAGTQPETEAPVCGDQYDESACQLTPGHEGSHADWNRAWDHGRASAVTEEPGR